MKTVVILFAGNTSNFAFEPLFAQKSAVDCAINWATLVPDVASIAILGCKNNQSVLQNISLPAEKTTFKHIFEEKWTTALLLQKIAEVSAGFDAAVFAFADAPFYSLQVTEQLLKDFKKYGAEYCFADGYPLGYTPEILHPGTAKILADLAKDNQNPVTQTVLFDVLKTDINSFEIETEIAPKDLRYLRLSLFCDTKRNTLQCTRLFNLMQNSPNASLCEIAENEPQIQRTLPAFYALQIAAGCPGECTFCPYPNAAFAKYGAKPQNCTAVMPLDSFEKLIEKIADFSDDAVISLSLWGEALNHPNLIEILQIILKNPKLSVLIESCGDKITPDFAQKVFDICRNAPERRNGQKAVNWIISVDAVEPDLYQKMHGVNGFETALNAVHALLPHFAGCVYPQFLRTTQNEHQMEQFYRLWKEKCGNVIIQKYDDFAGMLEQKKVADLTPVCRNACWHLRRDMNILLDGSVPLCKENVLGGIIGNAFTEPLEEIWKKTEDLYASQLKRNYEGLCKNCDEYYTFNF